ncbi:hypothetical protein GWI33_003818 [Rhynchophorus ferrugineus]|uniref:Uncharacterized protein n=1 Tax=Rhynchophorus ferrugineus TaxID=354439 RepID=A0A834LXR7_RHYFE|nr:hypothetical protein GWI33_003820 [Rhynchophorus ferrugineus]KAF7262935.1 hypothetical protein GWI33_003818 [Rhynchophorus ferrugineus]
MKATGAIFPLEAARGDGETLCAEGIKLKCAFFASDLSRTLIKGTNVLFLQTRPLRAVHRTTQRFFRRLHALGMHRPPTILSRYSFNVAKTTRLSIKTPRLGNERTRSMTKEPEQEEEEGRGGEKNTSGDHPYRSGRKWKSNSLIRVPL